MRSFLRRGRVKLGELIRLAVDIEQLIERLFDVI